MGGAAFGVNLQALRERKGWSQRELARQAYVDSTYVSQLERGLKSPSLKIIERLAKALDERPSELVRRGDEEPAGREGHDGTGRRETRGRPGNGSAGPKRRVVARTPRAQARQLQAEQREARVVKLLLAGKTQAEAAREVGVSQSRVSQIRTATRHRYVELTHEQWALYLPRQLAEISALKNVLFPRAAGLQRVRQPDGRWTTAPPDPRALTLLLKLMEREASLLGLDADDRKRSRRNSHRKGEAGRP